MTREELIRLHKFYCEKMNALVQRKNADYTNESGPFSNFERVEALGIATTEQGFLTRLMDKFCRVITFVQRGTLKVSDESVEDTLLDLANYSLLLCAYIQSKRERVCKPTSEQKAADISNT